MPSTYAHRRFGQDVLSLLPEEERAVIEENRALYDIGLHGPDILFYFRPLSQHWLRWLGGRMHGESGYTFFSRATMTLCTRGEPRADLSYLYGFVCHFALDRACHGYINRTEANTSLTHDEIEGEFDRFLLVRDGLDPLSAHLADHIHADSENAEVIARYFDKVRPLQIEEALRTMVISHELLRCPHLSKRIVIEGALRLAGKYDSLHGHIINLHPDPRCRGTNCHLIQLYETALPEAAEMISTFKACARGERSWPSIYDDNFVSEHISRKRKFI